MSHTHTTETATLALIQAVQTAGLMLRQHYGNVPEFRNKSVGAADVVTTLDIEAEKMLQKQLAQHDSSIGFKGEELDHHGPTDRYWLVDPIDGTMHFIRGTPFCTVMAALVEHGVVMTSVIFNIATMELFVATRGKGAYRNGTRIHVSNRSLTEANLSVETNLTAHPRNVEAYVNIRRKAIVSHHITCGYEFGLVAQGKMEGRISFDPFGKDWDFAAGTLLVEEAGGIVTNIGSDRYDINNYNIIAANPQVHEELSRADSPLAVLTTK